MKYVFPTIGDVAHVWAQRSQESGKSNNLYFEGATIYSYGPHFPIASFVYEDGSIARVENDGEKCSDTRPVAVLFNVRHYSISTSNHQSLVLSSIDKERYKVFSVPNALPYGIRLDEKHHKENLANYENQFLDSLGKAKRSRKYIDWHINASHKTALEHAAYMKFFNIKKIEKLVADDETNQSLIEKMEKHAKVIAERNKQARIKRKEDLKNAQPEIEKWRQNAGPLPAVCKQINKIYLRCYETDNRVGEYIETSQSARVPVDDASLLWPLIKRVKREGKAIHERMQLGSFHLDRINANGSIKVGCHHIDYNELELMAKTLNL